MPNNTRAHVHTLVDHLPPTQLAAIETILESMLRPAGQSSPLVPMDDEPFTDEDRSAVAEADEWRRHNEPIPVEIVLADLSLSGDDWKAMCETPLDQPLPVRRDG